MTLGLKILLIISISMLFVEFFGCATMIGIVYTNDKYNKDKAVIKLIFSILLFTLTILITLFALWCKLDT